MKPPSPHDPFDDLIAAALHGELTPAERVQFENQLNTDPAARAAYQEAQAMHDLLDKTHANAQPDPNFEQRMISGVRRKIEYQQKGETAWESALVLWRSIARFLRRRQLLEYGMACVLIFTVATTSLIYTGNRVKGVFTTISRQLAYADAIDGENLADANAKRIPAKVLEDLKAPLSANEEKQKLARLDAAKDVDALTALKKESEDKQMAVAPDAQLAVQAAGNTGRAFAARDELRQEAAPQQLAQAQNQGYATDGSAADGPAPAAKPASVALMPPASVSMPVNAPTAATAPMIVAKSQARQELEAARAYSGDSGAAPAAGGMKSDSAASSTAASPDASRKLIRNAQLDLEVKSYQSAMDQITAMTRNAGGYVDTSSSQKGGNGKLQGSVVLKILPESLDNFLLKLRDLGLVQNQSVSTDDVTRDYFDTQARLENSRRMETQLQELLKRENGKVSDLLQVERELGRVRGSIEEMQGQLKLYDFQVQYATITIQMREKDLNKAAAYLLREQDDFSLFATDVEGTFQKIRQAADSFKAQVLAANLDHNSGSDVTAELTVMVVPDQIESFLSDVRGLGRVANFTRQTQRVAKDGGDSDQPADETLTEKDKVQVHLIIRSDDESRKQVTLTVVTSAVDDALDQAKSAALAQAGAAILSSSLNKTPEGQSTGQLSVRVPGQAYSTLLAAFRALGRTSSFSLQRNDDSGPGANGDDEPVILSLSLTDDDAPLQQTELSVRADDVNDEAQQLKKDAVAAGVEIKASSFAHQPDGTEAAEMTFRLPMAKYPAFVDMLKKLGKVESLTVRREDRPDQTRTDDTAPAEISLLLHNERDIVAEDNGLWATLRQTFGDGANALFASVRIIGVIAAFLAPWVVMLLVLAWTGRRIYIWRKR
ncbi:MAG: DUF4349 domain-containing protein [Methylacidiphilales bacterium]|nr:DUF4349 domain-containing protein [Candidatus Methylacidiphilales bacterium]